MGKNGKRKERLWFVYEKFNFFNLFLGGQIEKKREKKNEKHEEKIKL